MTTQATAQAAAHDLVIRGGLVVDGTGAPGRRADVAVRDGKLSEIAAVTGRAKREISAAGLVVAPRLRDRGRLPPGLATDITVFDPDTIADHEPELVHDLPGGGPRLVQRASGIRWSFVNGHAVIEDGRLPEPAGTRGPGRLLRAS